MEQINWTQGIVFAILTLILSALWRQFIDPAISSLRIKYSLRARTKKRKELELELKKMNALKEDRDLMFLAVFHTFIRGLGLVFVFLTAFIYMSTNEGTGWRDVVVPMVFLLAVFLGFSNSLGLIDQLMNFESYASKMDKRIKALSTQQES